MKAYVFPAKFKNKAKLRLDAHNVSEPLPVHSGPHAGKVFLDAEMAGRDDRWIPKFRPLIADLSNSVELVDLTPEEITAPSPTR